MKPRVVMQAVEVESPSVYFARELASRTARSRINRSAGSGLTGHMRSSWRRSHSLPRWLVFTVAAGAFVAIAFVNFLAR